MPPDPRDAASLHDMMKAAEAIARYPSDKSYSDYLKDEMLRDATERRIEIIGEAARRISDSFRTSHSQVPSRKIIATRHILAHDYDEVNHEIVWRIATSYVPQRLLLVRPLIPEEPKDPEPDTETP